MSLSNYKHLNRRMPASFYKLFEPKKTLFDLTPIILIKILSFIDSTSDYKNARATCKIFYELLENIYFFSSNQKISKIIYFKNHNLLKINYFTTIIFSSGSKYYYCYKETNYLNNIKNGLEFEYNYNGSLRRNTIYKDNKKNGICVEYSKNRVISHENYITNIKNGLQSYFINRFQALIIVKYVIGIKLNFKKYMKSNLVIDASFKNKYLEGRTNVFSKDGIYISAILNFNKDRLCGDCKMYQFDRILKLKYLDGYLDGIQAVYTNEKKLKFLGEYKNSKLSGRYTIFNDFKKVEEGYYNTGSFSKYIKIFDHTELSNYKYPIKYSMLDGIYEETNHLSHITALFSENKFIGKYYQSNVKDGETIEFAFYNKNNFTYRRFKYGKELIILTKNFGKYTLTIYNLEESLISNNLNNPRKKKIYLLMNYNE